MNDLVENTRRRLEQAWSNEVPLRLLLGNEFEGHFGEYHLAGTIDDLRKQKDGILINWRLTSPYLRYVDGVGVQYHLGGDIFASTDFVLD